MTWHKRDMRDLPWAGACDAALCFGNSFGYLDDAGNRAFLQAVVGGLKRGGRFLLETGMAAESFFPHFQERRWYALDNLLFLIHNRYDPLSGRLFAELAFVRDGRVESAAFRSACLVARAGGLDGRGGFADLQPFGSRQQEPFQLGSPLLFLAATK